MSNLYKILHNVCTIKYKGESPIHKEIGNAGWDICSLYNEVVGIQERRLVHTGIYLEIPEGYYFDVRSRSGLALKHGVMVLNSPGTIDSSYRGEVCVILYNSSDRAYHITKGDRVAQLVLQKEHLCEFVEDELSGTDRGEGGFGSTGK